MHVIDYALIRAKKIKSAEKAYLNEIRQSLPRARRFIFDDDAARIMGRFIRECPDLLLNNRQFAIPPYQTTYIQIPIRSLFMPSSTSAGRFGGERDDFVGYLMTGNRVYSAAAFEHSIEESFLSPFVYDVNTTHHTNSVKLTYSTSRSSDVYEDQDSWMKLSLLLGSTVEHITEEQRVDIIRRNNIDMMYELPLGIDMTPLLQGSMGDVRNIWAALLLLNQPGKTVFEHFPAGRRIVRGKLRAYSAYNIVSINIGRHRKTRRAFHFEDRSSPRRHEVRGHFAHFHTDKHCEHKWPLIPDDDQRWYCERCRGFRIWRKDHLRGDASKGYVNKVYEIHE